ncbi:ABC transporter permease [Actinomadura sp. HBU206391]|uniref:ABC transporter permease n=1 Tax=Actinomadura sp. HBU206391 TaxID=2731692 RepID=UPI001650662B|nr:ABC transporter permease [Actinomadura sp. HBU206391]MBC6463137.1 ABC transporter permease [Actinomadura sp. HBU206391]
MPRETLLVFRHQLDLTLRSKMSIAFGAMQPVLYLVLFGPLLTGFGGALGGDSWNVLVPGLLVQLGLLSAGLAGFGIVFDARFGVLERLRVTPVSRLALLLGRVLSSTLVLMFQAALLVGVAVALGLRAPLPGLLIGLGLLTLLAVSLAALSPAAAITMPQPEMFAPLMSTVVVPLMLLSGAFLPMSLAPGWLDVLSRLTPFRYIADGLRAAFAGHYADGPLLWGALAAALLSVVSLTIGTRTFLRENA